MPHTIYAAPKIENNARGVLGTELKCVRVRGRFNYSAIGGLEGNARASTTESVHVLSIEITVIYVYKWGLIKMAY